jgi:hypothetical protein
MNKDFAKILCAFAPISIDETAKEIRDIKVKYEPGLRFDVDGRVDIMTDLNDEPPEKIAYEEEQERLNPSKPMDFSKAPF